MDNTDGNSNARCSFMSDSVVINTDRKQQMLSGFCGKLALSQ